MVKAAKRIDPEIEKRGLEDAHAVLSLAAFVRRIWEVVEPDDALQWGPHIDIVCDAIQRQLFGDKGVADKDYQNLMFLLPPGSLKSWLVSVARPAWVWLHESSRSSWYISASIDLTKRDSRRTRMILESEIYGRLREVAAKMASADLPCEVCGRTKHDMWKFAEDQNEKTNFETSNKGSRWCMPLGAKGTTGNRAKDFVFDDLVDIPTYEKASPDSQRQMLKDADSGMSYIEATRAKNLKFATRTLVMQRVSDGDPADIRIKQGGWKVICLPMEFDPAVSSKEDWRTVRGQWLLPGMFSEQEKSFVMSKIGAHGYATQYGQRATAKVGGLVDPLWTEQSYDGDPHAVADECDTVEIWVDTAVKGKETSDDCALLVVGRKDRHVLLLDDRTGKMGWIETKAAVRQARRDWPQARAVVIEDKASGSQLAEELSAGDYDHAPMSGVVSFNPGKMDKRLRWEMFAKQWFQALDVLFPHFASWLDAHRAEVQAFTGRVGGKDNRVDCWSMGLKRWGASRGSAFDVAALEAMMENAANDGEFAPAVMGHNYIVLAGPNVFGGSGAPAAWTVVDTTEKIEVASWSGRIDPIGYAVALATTAQKYNNALVVVHTGAPAAITALVRRGGIRVWQDEADVEARPGWWASRADDERAVGALARLIRDGDFTIRSRPALSQLMSSTDGALDQYRVLPYAMAADMLERVGALKRPKNVVPLRDPKTGAINLKVYFGERFKASSL